MPLAAGRQTASIRPDKPKYDARYQAARPDAVIGAATDCKSTQWRKRQARAAADMETPTTGEQRDTLTIFGTGVAQKMQG